MGAIRILLAFSVVVWHVPGSHHRLLNAAVAVLLFFVVSGFYMALVINEKYAPSGPGWIKRFYVARFLRLYPAYIAMCAVMVAWYTYWPSPNVITWRLPVSLGEQLLLALINIGIVGQDLYELMNHIGADRVRSLFGAGFFNPAFMLVGQAWSLSSEIFFYALAPIIVRSPLRLVAVLTISLAIRFSLVSAGWTSGFWSYWFIPATMCMFTLGSLSYFIYRRIGEWRWSAPIGWSALVFMIGWVVALSLLYGVALPRGSVNSLDEPRFWIAYLLFAALLPFVFCATKRLRVDRAIGDLSYPLYLVHGLVVGIIFIWFALPSDSLSILAFAMAASLTAAIAMRVMVEIPAELLVQAYSRRQIKAIIDTNIPAETVIN
jgi:peptidoglycan/LPS O-acetylase OafA/YrhL